MSTDDRRRRAREQPEGTAGERRARRQAQAPAGQRRSRKPSAASAGARRAPKPAEVSAGGVVVRDGEVAVIVPTRRAADGRRVLALPKGHVDEGETPLQAAIREVREEAGVAVRHLADLGEVRYWYTRGGRRIAKAVSFYLFGYLSGAVEDHDEEVEDARWMPLAEAARALSYAGEREMVQRASELLRSREGSADR